MTMLDLDRVDLGELCSALEDNSPEHAWWLDPVNGALELRSAYFDELEEEDKEPSERGLIVIDPLGSHEAYADMEDFATSVLDPRARDLLMRAIELERMDAVLWRHSLANDTVVTELPVSEGEYQQSDEPLLNASAPRAFGSHEQSPRGLLARARREIDAAATLASAGRSSQTRRSRSGGVVGLSRVPAG